VERKNCWEVKNAGGNPVVSTLKRLGYVQLQRLQNTIEQTGEPSVDDSVGQSQVLCVAEGRTERMRTN
jgi:hypothetical protein